MSTATKDLYALGEAPPLGQVPPTMHAMTIRQERFGEPKDAFQPEVVPVPEIGPREALVYVMAAGINYNNVWAALGIARRRHQGARSRAATRPASTSAAATRRASSTRSAAKSRTSRSATRSSSTAARGIRRRADVKAGDDPMFAPSFKIWGYETNWGSFAQFTKVQAHQCLPKAKHLTWEAAAAPTLVGATAYRMLHDWPPHNVRQDDVVLVWGGAGGLGSMAIQIVKRVRRHPDRRRLERREGRVLQEARRARATSTARTSTTGARCPTGPTTRRTTSGSRARARSARRSGRCWASARSPRIVFEHPGQDTIPTVDLRCDNGGMVVICAGTTGFNADVDLRYLWMRQKRLQGSHFANDEQANGFNQLVLDGKIDPCLSRVFPFAETGECHQLMHEGTQPRRQHGDPRRRARRRAEVAVGCGRSSQLRASRAALHCIACAARWPPTMRAT